MASGGLTLPPALRAIFDIRRAELPLALLMFAHFFLVITSFWILKPIKKSIFIEFYDQSGFDLWFWHLNAAQSELLAKVLNMLVAIAAVVVFTLLVRRLRREGLTVVFAGVFIAGYLVFARALQAPGDLAVWSFYLFGDLFATLMVTSFFVFVNDSFTPGAARRLYGLIGLGGVSGGVFGTNTVRSWIHDLSAPDWLWVTGGLTLAIIAIALIAGHLVRRNPPPAAAEPPAADPSAAPLGRTAKRPNPATEGARLVFASPYLFAIAAMVGLYEIVSTLVDFQFTSTIVHYLDGPAIGAQFANVFTITNIVAFLVQLFLTGFVMSRLGLGVALLVLPATLFLGSAAFMIAPLLWVGSLLNTADNGFSYSLNQSAKEALYVPTSADEKYKAKAFIDMFVQRFAKAIAVGVSLAITLAFSDFDSLRWLSLITVALLVVWVVAARYAGRRFREMTEG